MKRPSFWKRIRPRMIHVIRLDELVRELRIQGGNTFRLEEVIRLSALRTKRSDLIPVYFIQNSQEINEAIICLDPTLGALKRLMEAKTRRGNPPRLLYGVGFVPSKLVERVIDQQKEALMRTKIPS